MIERALLFSACALLLCVGCPRVKTVGLVEDEPAAATPDAAVVDAGQAEDSASARPDRVVIDECVPDDEQALASSTIAALLAGGVPDPSMRVLYPYRGTVFPRGLSAPVLMWEGPPADAVYVHLFNDALDYRGCLRPDGAGQLTLPATGWLAAEQAASRSAAPLVLALTSISGGLASGPIAQDLTIAPGELGGAVYYMSYGSPIAAPATTAVLRVRPGGSAEPFIVTLSCSGCHSASADGSVFTANNSGLGAVFDLGPSGVPTQRPTSPLATGLELAALVPDGSLYVAPAHPPGLGPRALTLSSQQSVLFDTLTGQAIAESGVVSSAVTPAFSADGTLLTFVDAAIAGGRSLAVMRFALASRKASEHRVLFTDEQRYPGWPSFLPDRSGIVFALGERSDFSGNGAGLHPTDTMPGPASDLYAVGTSADLASAPHAMLTRAMGFDSAADAAAERTYLPFGAEDLHQSYNPSVSSVRSGGYDWVFFDAFRHYGNRGKARQIWVAALDASRAGSFDPDASHPAFYLPGQELAAGNVRPVFARDVR